MSVLGSNSLGLLDIAPRSNNNVMFEGWAEDMTAECEEREEPSEAYIVHDHDLPRVAPLSQRLRRLAPPPLQHIPPPPLHLPIPISTPPLPIPPLPISISPAPARSYLSDSGVALDTDTDTQSPPPPPDPVLVAEQEPEPVTTLYFPHTANAYLGIPFDFEELEAHAHAQAPISVSATSIPTIPDLPSSSMLHRPVTPVSPLDHAIFVRTLDSIEADEPREPPPLRRLAARALPPVSPELGPPRYAVDEPRQRHALSPLYLHVDSDRGVGPSRATHAHPATNSNLLLFEDNGGAGEADMDMDTLLSPLDVRFERYDDLAARAEQCVRAVDYVYYVS